MAAAGTGTALSAPPFVAFKRRVHPFAGIKASQHGSLLDGNSGKPFDYNAGFVRLIHELPFRGACLAEGG
jgi:hypothetical protein